MNSSVKALCGVLVVGFTIAGCESGADDPVIPPPQPPIETTQVRFIHASPDAPNVNISGIARSIASDLAYQEIADYQDFAVGTLTVQVDAIVPGGEVTVIGPVDLDLASGTNYTVVASGNAASIAPIVIASSANSVAAGSVRAQVLHAAPDAPPVDVYVTAPGALLAQEVSLGSFAFGESLGPVEVPAGDYQIRVTLPSDPTTVVYDSGTISLADGSDLLISAVANTGPGAAPISLIVAGGVGGFTLPDVATPAEVRVIHVSPDAPAVDVIVNDDFANPVLANVPYPAFSNYLSLAPGAYNFKVTAAGNPSAIVIDADVDLTAGQQYSVYATNVLAEISPLVTLDDDRDVVTEVKLRILHLAPGAGLVDVYLTGVGEDISTLDPTLSDVDFLADTGYLSVPGGSYDVTVTVAGTKTAAIGPAAVTLLDGGVYTAAARDETGGGAPFGLILLDDFTP
jgi:hypothetical protein